MKKWYLLTLCSLLVLVLLCAFPGRAFASTANTLHTNKANTLNDACTGSACNAYKAAGTNCTDNFQLDQDVPIYNAQSQVGTLRLWYSNTCQTYWSQIFATDCTNIDQFEASVYYANNSSPIVDDTGLEGGCSLSSHMLYPTQGIQGGGSIHFTDGRGWVAAPMTSVWPAPSSQAAQLAQQAEQQAQQDLQQAQQLLQQAQQLQQNLQQAQQAYQQAAQQGDQQAAQQWQQQMQQLQQQLQQGEQQAQQADQQFQQAEQQAQQAMQQAALQGDQQAEQQAQQADQQAQQADQQAQQAIQLAQQAIQQ